MANTQTGFKTVCGEGDSPDHGLRHGALLRGLRKIGTVPDGFESGSSIRVCRAPSPALGNEPLLAVQRLRQRDRSQSSWSCRAGSSLKNQQSLFPPWEACRTATIMQVRSTNSPSPREPAMQLDKSGDAMAP